MPGFSSYLYSVARHAVLIDRLEATLGSRKAARRLLEDSCIFYSVWTIAIMRIRET